MSFTLELDRSEGPLGLRLEGGQAGGGQGRPGPLVVRALAEGGVAHRSRALRPGDQLVEVGGVCVRGRTLDEVEPLLSGRGTVRLKLTRAVSVPERESRPRLPAHPPAPAPLYAPLPNQPPAQAPLYAPLHPPPPAPRPLLNSQVQI